MPRPDVEPRASETIPEIIDLVCQLVAGGHAYEAQGSVYFRVRSFPEYGKLSNQRIDELEEEARVEAEPGKEDPLDFAVWKAAKPGEREHLWESPWGMGRPGWHIECSAMGLRYLGAGFDIHGGGRDLIFPHHENEIAQAEAAGMPFARIWMHNGMIRSGGEKMAKSVGNIFLLREVLDRYPAPVVLTYFLTTHYRSPLEFSLEKLDEAAAAYGRLVEAVRTASFRADNPGRGETSRSPPSCAPRSTARAAGLRRAHGRRPEHGRRARRAVRPGPRALPLRGRRRRRRSRRRHRPPSKTSRTCSSSASTTSASRCPTPACRSSPGSTPTPAARRSAARRPTARSAPTDDVPLPPAARLAGRGPLGRPRRPGRRAPVVRRRQLRLPAARPPARPKRTGPSADGLRDRLEAAGFEVRDTPAGTQVVRKG